MKPKLLSSNEDDNKLNALLTTGPDCEHKLTRITVSGGSNKIYNMFVYHATDVYTVDDQYLEPQINRKSF